MSWPYSGVKAAELFPILLEFPRIVTPHRHHYGIDLECHLTIIHGDRHRERIRSVVSGHRNHGRITRIYPEAAGIAPSKGRGGQTECIRGTDPQAEREHSLESVRQTHVAGPRLLLEV